MLSTGIKTPVGIKLTGPDLNVLSELGSRIEAVVRDIRELCQPTRNALPAETIWI